MPLDGLNRKCGQEVVKKRIEDTLRIGKSYNECVASLESIYQQGEASIL